MKKSLIALAALAATGAFAQSSVSLYGRLDVGYANQKVTQTGINGGGVRTAGASTENSYNGVSSHNSVSSYWGLTGTEDMGGGLKANFKLEADLFPVTGATGSSGADSGFNGTADRYATNVANANGGGGAFNRISYVGLDGSFGSIRLGRDYLPTFQLGAATDPFGQAWMTTVGTASTGAIGIGLGETNAAGANVSNGVGTTVARQLMYISPNLSGFQIKAAYGNTDTSETGTAANDQISKLTNVSGVYTNGPLMVGIAFGVNEAVNGAPGTGYTKNDLTLVAGSYDFGSFKLNAQYATAKRSVTNLATEDLASETNVSAVVPFGAVNLLVGYGYNTYNSNVTGRDGNANGTDWTVGADYAMSKRTTAFVRTGSVNNLSGRIAGVDTETKRTSTNVGIRHLF